MGRHGSLAPAFIRAVRHKQTNKKHGVTVTIKHGAAIFDGSDVDPSWEGYIGQDKAKAQLQLAIKSSQVREKRLGHVLLASGIAGLGKSHLAKLVAYKLDTGLVEASGPMTADQFHNLVSVMSDGDCLFIDEIHTLGKGCDWLLRYMLDQVLLTGNGEEQLPDVTIIGATTDAGKLSDPLLTRFSVRPELSYYSDEESIELVENLASRMGVALYEGWPVRIAKAANSNPRLMRNILGTVLDMQVCGEVDLTLAFSYAGLTEDGLDTIAVGFLITLFGANNNTASRDTVAATLNEGVDNLRFAERNLLQNGFITIGGRGRTLTDIGFIRAEELLG